MRAARSDIWLVVHDNRMLEFRHSALAPLFATIARSGRVMLMRSVLSSVRELKVSKTKKSGQDEQDFSGLTK
jgi:hypothetical protein